MEIKPSREQLLEKPFRDLASYLVGARGYNAIARAWGLDIPIAKVYDALTDGTVYRLRNVGKVTADNLREGIIKYLEENTND